MQGQNWILSEQVWFTNALICWLSSSKFQCFYYLCRLTTKECFLLHYQMNTLLQQKHLDWLAKFYMNCLTAVLTIFSQMILIRTLLKTSGKASKVNIDSYSYTIPIYRFQHIFVLLQRYWESVAAIIEWGTLSIAFAKSRYCILHQLLFSHLAWASHYTFFLPSSLGCSIPRSLSSFTANGLLEINIFWPHLFVWQFNCRNCINCK